MLKKGYILLYLGNMLSIHGRSVSIIETITPLLAKNFSIISRSSKQNLLLRLLDMLWAIWRNRNQTGLVLIDSYSTLAFWYTILASQLCRILKIPYIPILHGGNFPSRLATSPQLTKLVFTHAHAIVSPSLYLKTHFENCGFKTTLIPNFIKIENYPFNQKSKVRPRLLWVRSFDAIYHPEMTIRVFAEVQKNYPEAKLCMVGPEKDGSMERCQALSVEFGLAKHITFTGRLSKTQWIALAAEYDLFISTTRFDNTPVSVIEAMALGLPIVSTNVGGMPYLLEHGRDGLLSPDNDIPAMVKNILILLTTPALAESLSKNARQKAESFDWNLIEKQWLDLLQ